MENSRSQHDGGAIGCEISGLGAVVANYFVGETVLNIIVYPPPPPTNVSKAAHHANAFYAPVLI